MNLSDLLGVPLTTSRPNAYQLLGLEVGESDRNRVLAALQKVTRQLRTHRPSVDPALWDKAARAVTQAKEILTDPTRKAAYDAKLLVGVDTSEMPTANRLAELDPVFLKLLPCRLPHEAFDVARYSTWAQEFAGEFDDEGYQPDAQASESASRVFVDEEPIRVVSVANDLVEPAPQIRFVKRARRRLPIAGILMTLMVLGMLGGVLCCLYLLTNREQGVQIAKAASVESELAPPNLPKKKPNVVDRVMGSVDQKVRSNKQNRLASGFKIEDGNSPFAKLDTLNGRPETGSMSEVATEPALTNPESGMNKGLASQPSAAPMPTTTTVEPIGPTTPEPPSPEMIAAADQAIADFVVKLRERRLKIEDSALKLAADKAVTDEQKLVVDSWQRLIAYAREYDTSIRQAAKGLNAGETILVADNPIAHVETTTEKVIFRNQGRNKEYPLAELPPVLADALSRLKLDASHPTTKVYRASYKSFLNSPAARKDAVAEIERLAAELHADEIDLRGIKERIDDLLQKVTP